MQSGKRPFAFPRIFRNKKRQAEMRIKLAMSSAVVLALLAGATAARADTIYWATGNDGTSLINFNTTTGATTVVGSFGSGHNYGLAFAPNGTAYTLQGSTATLARINLATGALTTIGGPGNFFGYALDFANDGTLYGVNQNDQIYSINTTTSAFTFLRNMSNPSLQIMDITFDLAGNLYGVGPNDNRVYRIDLATGNTTLAYSTALGNLMGIAADANGDLIALSYASPSRFERINRITGTSQIIGVIGGTSLAHGDDIPLTAAVPEPSATLLLGLSLVGLMGYGWRQWGA